MSTKSICELLLALLSTLLFLYLIVHEPLALARFEAAASDGPGYSVGDTEASNLIVTDNRRNTLFFYTIDKDQEVGSPLNLRGSIDLTQVGKPVVKLSGPASRPVAEAKANLTIIVPAADAQIFFDDTPTSQTGTERAFLTPPLEVGKTYTYRVRVRWQENGKPVEQTRTVDMTGGGTVRVDFTRPPTDK
jgi:uncharacterized protein (TIGR03000 family)